MQQGVCSHMGSVCGPFVSRHADEIAAKHICTSTRQLYTHALAPWLLTSSLHLDTNASVACANTSAARFERKCLHERTTNG